MLDSGENRERAKKKFIFEKWWLKRAEFKDIVNKVCVCGGGGGGTS
jgi:hypothetical protein